MPDNRAELTRATLEGVGYNLRSILDSLRGQGVELKAMRLIGGGAKSQVWRQILADIQSGGYAEGWIDENENGRPWFNQKRIDARQSDIETVGKQLRAMMPWLNAKVVE